MLLKDLLERIQFIYRKGKTIYHQSTVTCLNTQMSKILQGKKKKDSSKQPHYLVFETESHLHASKVVVVNCLLWGSIKKASKGQFVFDSVIDGSQILITILAIEIQQHYKNHSNQTAFTYSSNRLEEERSRNKNIIDC